MLMQQLGQAFAAAGYSTQYHDASLLVNIPLSRGRSQAVKITSFQGRFGNYCWLRYQSRVCQARDAATVRTALTRNADMEWPAYALDVSGDPPAIDVVYSDVADGINPNQVLATIQTLAAFADHIEQQVGGADQF